MTPYRRGMLISGREAVRILLTRGAMTGEAQARGLLRAGAAGRGVVADTGVLFERDAVTELADRPWLDRSAQEAACPLGSYVARLPRTTSVDLTRPWAEIAQQVSPIPTMPPMTTTLLGVSIRAAGRLPWVATLHGFVVLGGDLAGIRVDDQDVRRFRLEPPGEWFAAWRHRRVALSRGGRPWVINRGRVP